MMNTYVINNHQLTSVAVLVVIIAIASSTMTSAATEDANYTWIICNSHRDVPSTTGTSRLHKEGLVPPSQWDSATHQQHCFLQRTDTSSAPGTALFQHWLADFDSNITNDSNNKSQNTKHNHDSFDPWTDFPTWEIMRQYPDIGEDDRTRDYYTLWYTSTVDLPGSGAFKSGESSAELLKKDEGTSLHAEKYNGWKRGHLTLHGVNYQPIVYYDGKRLSPYPTSPGDDASSTSDENSGGMFLRRHYDLGIVDHTIGDTSPSSPLEILVLPPPVVGKNIFLNSTEVSSTYGLEDGQGGDHRLAESGAIMQFTAGWDWIKSTPDRNTGIWDRVEVEWVLGDVRLHDLHVKILNITTESSSENVQESLQEPALPLGDDVKVSAWLDLSLSATYHGQGSTPIQGQFDYWITLSKSEFPILARGTIYNVTIQQLVEDYHIGKVFLPDVNLWWPHTYSKRHRQPLYTAHVKFSSPGSEEESPPCLHQTQANFGVRTISSFIHPRTKSFALRVNGHPIFLTGGNWITTDQFLRYANSPKRYFQELSLLRHAGMNSIRVWGGGLAETDHFYDTADALGLIVYQEFWMTGDNNGNMAGDYDWPNDHGSYLANARDTIKKLRNHPSLGWYGGGNELLPIPSGTEEGGTSPPRDIEAGLAKYIMELDGSRSYITSSVTDIGSMFSGTHSLAPRDGPYGVLSEELFFDRNPGLTSPLLSDDEMNKNMAPSDVMDKDSPGRNIGFQSEVGSASHPELESLKRFLSPKALNAFPDCGEASGYGGSIHEEWSYFKYQPFSDGDGVDHICMFMYPPRDGNATTQRMESIEEYSWAAQFAQYLQYKALFEGYSYQMWEWYSAIFLWKASSPAPTFRGALYDWLLETNGGYWGARAGLAGGSPIRLILNLRDWTINVINTVPVAAVVTSVEWEAYSLEGELMGNGQVLIPQDRIEGSSVAHLGGSLPWIGESDSVLGSHKLQKILLYRLRLSYVLGATTEIARNSYFLTDPSLTEDHNYKHSQLSMLGAMRKEKIDLDASCTLTTTSAIECKLQNTHDSIVAIMIKMTLVQHSPTAGVSQPKDSRILPTLFSDNYLTLLPGETLDVYISIESMEYTLQKEIAKCFSKRSIQTSKNAESSHLMVLIDGWNVFQSNVIVSCSPAVMQPL